MKLRTKKIQILSRKSLPELKQTLCLMRQNLLMTKRKTLTHQFQ
jgi:hypothetical protein